MAKGALKLNTEIKSTTLPNAAAESINESANEWKLKKMQSQAEYDIQKEIYYAMLGNYQSASRNLYYASKADKGKAQKAFDLAGGALYTAETKWTIKKDHLLSDNKMAGQYSIFATMIS